MRAQNPGPFNAQTQLLVSRSTRPRFELFTVALCRGTAEVVALDEWCYKYLNVLVPAWMG